MTSDNRTKYNLSTDVRGALSPMEQELCKMFTRVELRGKRDNIAPVLLTEEIQASLSLMKQWRSAAGMRESNKVFVCFALV